VREHEHRFVVCERNARIVIVPAVVRRSRSERFFRTTRAKPAPRCDAALMSEANGVTTLLKTQYYPAVAVLIVFISLVCYPIISFLPHLLG
jgi:hypothetical protein